MVQQGGAKRPWIVQHLTATQDKILPENINTGVYVYNRRLLVLHRDWRQSIDSNSTHVWLPCNQNVVSQLCTANDASNSKSCMDVQCERYHKSRLICKKEKSLRKLKHQTQIDYLNSLNKMIAHLHAVSNPRSRFTAVSSWRPKCSRRFKQWKWNALLTTFFVRTTHTGHWPTERPHAITDPHERKNNQASSHCVTIASAVTVTETSPVHCSLEWGFQNDQKLKKVAKRSWREFSPRKY